MTTVLRFIDDTKVTVEESHAEVTKAVRQAAVQDTDAARLWPFVHLHAASSADRNPRCVNMSLVKDYYRAGKYER